MNDRAVPALRDHVRRLCPEWDVRALSGFMHLEGGYSNDNFRFDYHGERYVLRVVRQARANVDRAVEAAVYRSEGVPRPAVVRFDEASGTMISRWVPGTLLADLAAGTDPATLIAYLRELHAAMPALTRVYDPVAAARRHLSEANAPAWLDAVAADLAWAPAALAVCHNDLNPWNVIRTPGGWVTLDWEWVGLNDPLFDLVTLHQGTDPEAGPRQAELTRWAAAYLGRPADPARVRTCLLAFWLRETAWALAEVAAGNDRAEISAQARLGSRILFELGR
jgi:Ser/Thr protein kinase RdoA (MazF antagonist)